MSLIEKSEALKKILKDMESVLVGFSGGVDSTYLLAAAKEALGDKVLAVTAKSETYPEKAEIQAKQIAERLHVRYLTIHTKELECADFSSNPPNRCYYCKNELYSQLKKLAEAYSIRHVIDGSNADDVHDYRPGMIALNELGVRSPLREAGLSKSEIRKLSLDKDLPTWDMPASACLASRFPYGTIIDEQKLGMVEKAEEFLHSLGIKQVRVRHHDSIARVEILPEDIARVTADNIREQIVRSFKKIGYQYVALDLQGYRMGSMNETLERNDA